MRPRRMGQRCIGKAPDGAFVAREERMPSALASWARLLFLVVVFALGACGKSEKNGPDDGVTGQRLVLSMLDGIPQDGNALGNPDAPVVLTEFLDLQCPGCAAVGVITLPPIIERYVRTGKVRLVFETLAFVGPDSVEAAQMALAAAEQDKMFQFVELFVHNQEQPNTGYVTDESLRKIAQAVPGLDVEKAFDDRSSEAVEQRLADAREKAEEFGIEATPTFLIGRAGEKPKQLRLHSLDPAYLEEEIKAVLSTSISDGG